jgi:ADP-heptose:LPS heptosyltransferase
VGLAVHQAALGRTPVIFLSSREEGWEKHFRQITNALFPLSQNQETTSGVPSDPVLTAALAERLHVAVANCSGTGHMLALGGAPLITLFGPSKAEKFSPLARKAVHLKPTDGGKNIAKISIKSVIKAIDHMLSPPISP